MPEAPEVDASACAGRLGQESFLAPQLMTHAVRIKLDRAPGSSGSSNSRPLTTRAIIINKIGADGQVYGGC